MIFQLKVILIPLASRAGDTLGTRSRPLPCCFGRPISRGATLAFWAESNTGTSLTIVACERHTGRSSAWRTAPTLAARAAVRCSRICSIPPLIAGGPSAASIAWMVETPTPAALATLPLSTAPPPHRR